MRDRLPLHQRLDALEARLAARNPRCFEVIRTRQDGTKYGTFVRVPPGVKIGADVEIVRSYGGRP